ncbi:hypothetical protein D3C76_1158020 [compost metagenome]
MMVLAVDGDNGGWADGRRGNGIEMLLVQIQAAEAAVVRAVILYRAIGKANPQAAEAVIEPAREVALLVQR